jgi:hypothetical protein
MRRLVGLAALVFVGFLAWQVGNRLSTDAVGMAVGLVFGVLAGVPAALLVLATDRRRRDDDDYDAAYQAGIRDVAALAYTELPGHDKMCAEWAEAYMAQRNAPAVIVVERPAAQYTHAHPFGLLPAPATYRCPMCLTLFDGASCPECGDQRQWACDDTTRFRNDGTPLHHLPADPDDDCPDWCEPWMWEELYSKHLPQHGRRFRIVGEVE